jgi:hypothetical protein
LFGFLPISKMGVAARPAPGQRPVTPGPRRVFAGHMSLQKRIGIYFVAAATKLCEAKKSEMQIFCISLFDFY